MPIKLDIRVIAATHRDLGQMVAKGSFREDLWFRINAFPIDIPPLRRRRSDIPLLIKHFKQKKSRELGIQNPPDIDLSALDWLLQYSWPGNVRELENTIERALIQHRQGPLSTDSFSLPDAQKAIRLSSVQEPKSRTLDEVLKEHIKSALRQRRGKDKRPEWCGLQAGPASQHLAQQDEQAGHCLRPQASRPLPGV